MRYLSEEWITAANAAVQAAAHSAPPRGIVIDQHVTDMISYRVVIARGACSITALHDDAGTAAVRADAIFRQSRTTAQAVAQGTTDAHQAFLLGQITFEGMIDVLIERRDAVDWLESTLTPIMAATTFE